MHVTISYIVEEKSTTIKNVILLHVVLMIQQKTLNINDGYADFSPTYRHRLVVWNQTQFVMTYDMYRVMYIFLYDVTWKFLCCGFPNIYSDWNWVTIGWFIALCNKQLLSKTYYIIIISVHICMYLRLFTVPNLCFLPLKKFSMC